MSSKPPCPHGTQCLLQNDVNHSGQYSHSQLMDCPYGATCKLIGDRGHCQEYLHLQGVEKCPYGPTCKLRTSPGHEARYDHSGSIILSFPPVAAAPAASALPACPNGGLCHLRDPHHPTTQSHPPGWTPESGFEKASLVASQANETARNQSILSSGQDSRPQCSFYSTCYRTNVAHARQEAHPQGWKPTRRAGGASSSVSAPSSAHPTCKYGMSCWQTNSPHVRGFLHPPGWYPGLVPKPGPRAARTLTPCRYGSGCYITNPLHPRKYSHPSRWDPSTVKRGFGGRSSWNTPARWSHLHSNVRTLYHQTDATAAAAIIASQEFRRGGKDCWAGSAIYFAETAAETNVKARQKGVILRATVYLGRTKTVRTSSNFKSTHFHGLLSEGFDSIMIPAKTGKEFVVYNKDQVKNIQKD